MLRFVSLVPAACLALAACANVSFPIVNSATGPGDAAGGAGADGAGANDTVAGGGVADTVDVAYAPDFGPGEGIAPEDTDTATADGSDVGADLAVLTDAPTDAPTDVPTDVATDLPPAADVPTPCAACPNLCFAGTCVQCLADGDCPGGACNLPSHTCATSGVCKPPTPIKLANGSCVQCTNDTHCAAIANSPKCDLSTHTCGATTTSNECKACVDPYPGCVQIEGIWSCVECVTDSDCAKNSKGTCSATTYTCSGGGGTGPTTGTCKMDSDCVNTGMNVFDLHCDTASGLCYDAAGKCDNVAAFCMAGKGSTCTTPLPGLPGGPGGTAGSCTCKYGSSGGSTTNPICAILAPTCNCAVDPNSAACNSTPFGPCCGGGASGACLGVTPVAAAECFGGLQCGCELTDYVCLPAVVTPP